MKNSRSTEASNLVRGVGGDSSPLDAVLRPLGENQKWKTLARQNFPTSFEVTGGIHPLLTQSSDHLGRTKNEKLSHDRISEPRLRLHGDSSPLDAVSRPLGENQHSKNSRLKETQNLVGGGGGWRLKLAAADIAQTFNFMSLPMS